MRPELPPNHIAPITDPQLRKSYESNYAEIVDASDERRQVGALIAVHDLFKMLEGAHSPRVHDTLEYLLLPGLRQGLRDWYARADTVKDLPAMALKEQLSRLTGEPLAPDPEISSNPS